MKASKYSNACSRAASSFSAHAASGQDILLDHPTLTRQRGLTALQDHAAPRIFHQAMAEPATVRLAA